jgi:hypothetical protein
MKKGDQVRYYRAANGISVVLPAKVIEVSKTGMSAVIEYLIDGLSTKRKQSRVPMTSLEPAKENQKDLK